ncbi:MAG: glutamyl-tRNA reductase [Verrucomicrobiales bacterium]|jgi:glutamyl-tRNA reductase
MSVVVVGVNQRSIPIDAFEKLAIDNDHLSKVLDDLLSSDDITEAVVLSTCNRTEIYVRAERFHPAYAEVRDSLARHSGLRLDQFAEYLYTHADDDAARHLFGVASGLDSAVLGETEILGQVRKAFELAKSAGVVGSGLTDVFRAAGTAGRKVRASTGIARNITSVSRAAVAMATQHLGTLDGRSICVLGAGEMSEGMTVALRDGGTRRIVICNRTVERAKELAERVGGDVVPLDQLAETITDVDVLLTGTGANDLMVEHRVLADVMATRSDRPMLIVDIAVPRDVDPKAAEIEGITLLDMEDLTAFAEIGRAERRNEITAVRQVIDEEVARFMGTAASRKVEPLAAAFRRDAEALRTAEVQRLGSGLDVETQEHIDAATRAVLNKLLHRPMTELRDSAGTARGERLAEALQDLFDIEF